MSVSDTATGSLYRVVRASAGQQGLHDLLGDRSRNGAAEAVQLLLEHDGDRDLRICGGREADEPGLVDVGDTGLRCTGLPGDLSPRDLRRDARSALDDG